MNKEKQRESDNAEREKCLNRAQAILEEMFTDGVIIVSTPLKGENKTTFKKTIFGSHFAATAMARVVTDELEADVFGSSNSDDDTDADEWKGVCCIV